MDGLEVTILNKSITYYGLDSGK